MKTFLVLSLLFLLFAPQASAEVFTDNFSVSHDYLTEGVAGTGWDGFIGLGTRESVDNLNANIDRAGELFIRSTNGRWQDPFPPAGTYNFGPLLYKNVAGDFIAVVEVTEYQSGVNYNAGGLMARVAVDADAGAGEDWVANTYFPMFSVNNKMDNTNNGSRAEVGPWQASAHSYLMLKRVGDNFYGFVSDDGISWNYPLNNGDPVSRTDMTGLPVQVGIWQCTYIETTGYMAFDNFELSYTAEGSASTPSPSNGEDDVSVNTELSWMAGGKEQSINGHQLYIGTVEQDVNDANTESHPDVDLYIVSEPLCALGQLDTNQTYYWRVDEVNDTTTWKGDIWNFTTENGKAKEPVPADGYVSAQPDTLLYWTASGIAASHDVYFGTDEAAVTNATRLAGDIDGDGDVDNDDVLLLAQQWLLDPPVDSLPSADLNCDNNVDFNDWAILANDWMEAADSVFMGNQLSTTFNPGTLEETVQYFWRVDEVNECRTIKGDTWSFTTIQTTGYYTWPTYSPVLSYDYYDEYGEIEPPTQFAPDGVTKIVGTYVDRWWCFRWGSTKNDTVTEAAWIPMLERFNTDFDYITNIMRWPRDKRALQGYYSTVYLYGSNLSTDSEPNTATGGWQATHGGYPDVLASYVPVRAFDPAYYDAWQTGAMIHEGIHCVLSSMPGCFNSGWFHEGGNTWLQGTMEAQRSGNFSGIGWLSAGAAIAPFMPIECYSGWLQDDSFGGPSAEGVNRYEGSTQLCTWRNLLGGTQYGECFPHALEIILGPKSIAWIWRNAHYSGRVLQDMAQAPGGLGDAQTRRVIQEYRARQAFGDFGQWSYAYRQLLNNNWQANIHAEYEPIWINCDVWYATCYVATTQDGSVLTPEYRTLPGWSGANQIPLTVNPSATEATVTFNPIGANMSCQLVYRDTSGNIHYGAPVSSGTCSIPLANVRNNVIVAVICNTDYIYAGESTRTAKFDYTLTMGSGITGKASITTKWYDWSPSSYTITASAGPNGSINPSGAVSVNAGANRTFTFSPDPDYEVNEVILNGLPIGKLNSYTFTNVRGNHTIAVTFGGDKTPPTPNPATWALPPTVIGTDTITMTATTGSDASGVVEYYFKEVSGNSGGTDSGWQSDPNYTDTGLSEGMLYTYLVRMRDANQNTGYWSASQSAVTQTSVPTYVAAGSVASSSGTITPALPSGIYTGDILLLFLETANQDITITNQNGGTWTEVTGSPQGTGTAASATATRLTIFWSRYNGTQGNPTVSDSGDHQIGRMIAIRGAAASGDPWDVTAGGVEATSDTSGSIPGATTTVDNTLIVAAIATSLPDGNGTSNFSSWANANLTNLIERIDDTRSSGNGGGIGVVTGLMATAGDYGDTTVTCASSAVKAMISIAIKQ